ncbi:ribonuclease R [Marivibrio halodurans]|uniref:Ribonuclease R n=1 Tax=Marivibrio halodurans TaxID=2039722 RepID=A0A8J7SLJ9_9PROT|nr:ribonuclease R [Marivibrio halodurans]MBP5856908.1 ribonuclease R [Marivibrio halodurans]
MASGTNQDDETPLPSKQQIIRFIEESETPVGKREIARAFNIKGARRADLRELLKEIESEGRIDRGRGRRMAPAGALPEVAVLTVDRIDRDGEGHAVPTSWPEDAGAPPHVLIVAGPRSGPAPREGDRILAKLKRIDKTRYEAAVIRTLKPGPQKILGLLESAKGGAHLQPTDKRNDKTWFIEKADMGDARPGDLVLAETLPGGRGLDRMARVTDRIGNFSDPKAFSLIAIHSQAIPVDFPEAAVKEANTATVPPLGKRTDLRDLPLVTIDGADARDFDDAVHARPDPDPSNEGGFEITVAIADVSHYVRPESALDKSARERGNSVYFPDRVVPMLPEGLSNDLCSLRPDEDRACLAMIMRIDADGRLLKHKVVRGLMRSHARLTYTQVQNAADGQPDETTAPLLAPVIEPLYAAYAALKRHRMERGTLELDLPELQVVIGGNGQVERIERRQRFDSHRLIEEFMICANVAAAQALEAKRAPAIYRVHEPPPLDKLELLRESLDALGYKLAKGQTPKPTHFTGILDKAAGTERAQIVSDLVLRSQAQAVYSPENQGHFGLALERYCHFTSPIRRYADLLVHRSLVSAYGLGEGGLPGDQAERFDEMGEHISSTERRAIVAEREATDRYLSAYMSERIGNEFAGRITGVQRFGLFVRLEETGADGLVPVRSLPRDRYQHDEVHQRLVGAYDGLSFRLGDPVTCRLVEASPVSGGLILEIIDGGTVLPKSERTVNSPRRGGPGGGRRGGPPRGKSGPRKGGPKSRKPGTGKTGGRHR